MTSSTEQMRAEALVENAEAMLAVRSLAEALSGFHAAELAGADPDRCAGGRWSISMYRGDFEGAWRESDSIRGRGVPDPHRFWQGEPLDGQRVIVRCLHGFGDAVQFLRYLPRLRAVAASVVVEVPPRLLKLARWLEGADEVITWGEQRPVFPVAWTVQVEVMELPYIFRTQLHELPTATRYLRLPRAAARAGDLLRVGVMWVAGSWNSSRSMPPDCLRAILNVRGCEFWDLRGEESATIELPNLTLRVDPQCRVSIEGLAARVAGLDLVLTVDTLAAHVAGALGVPVWVMLPYASDWRWMHDREDSPWYPSLRLFRQSADNDWGDVRDAVVQALEQMVSASRQEHAAW